MSTQEIRRKFLNYFAARQHAIVPSSSVVPYDDPTLLFINAGMNQFKDVFLGKSKRDYKRAATSQKCIRAGGKHNDLENVGHTARHLTFFEMLGNFSFGDYFKKEAIQFAWEVSTGVFGFDPKLLWPTVFIDDEEAFELWTHYVSPERITRFGEKHNFWAMGETGPCGPCSELLYDRGSKYGNAQNPTQDMKEERYLEFWNLVFMQYNREEGRLMPLPRPCVDTGSGLERVLLLKMGVESVYETDVLGRLIQEVAKMSGVPYRPSEELGAAFRVIADHLRSLAFAIADGAQPSNVERGYVLRKILRRAVRYGRMLGLQQPFLARLLPALIEAMGTDYHELEAGKARISEILTQEEESFFRTLQRGGNLLNQTIEAAQNGSHQVGGDEAFKLKDTYGLPLEEILLIAKDAGLTVDTDGYQRLEKEAKERSRQSQKKAQQSVSESLFVDYVAKHGECRFLGFSEHRALGKVTALVVDGALVPQMEEGQAGMVVLDATPFYAEMGGQIGDTGHLRGAESDFQVDDCRSPFKGIIAHIGQLKSGVLRIGDQLTAEIDRERRQKIANNHTATHLLHWALQKVLGDHVKQAGSVVEPGRLRFDFSHHKSLTENEIEQIEGLVNAKIRENLPVNTYELTYEEAQKRREIRQFFGEKYGSRVRVVDIDFSKELCGGTHVAALGAIGLFRITKESSIAAGVRRIEACTGVEAELFCQKDELLIAEAAAKLKCDANQLLANIEKIIEENKQLRDQLKAIENAKLEGVIDELLRQVDLDGRVPLVAKEISVAPKELRACAERVLEKLGSGVVALGVQAEGKCQLLIAVSQDLVAKGLRADEMIREVAPLIGGGGGGKAHQAQAGGTLPQKLSEALQALSRFLQTHLTHRERHLS